MNAPGIRIKKSTTRAAPTELLKEPLSKNGVKKRDNENTIQILDLTKIWMFFSVLSTSQLYAEEGVKTVHTQVPFHSLTPKNSKNTAQILEIPFLISGPIGKEADYHFSELFDVKHAIRVSN